MALFGSSEKKPDVKTEFMFDTDSTINQSTLAKDIKINGSLESSDYIDFSGYLTGTITVSYTHLTLPTICSV